MPGAINSICLMESTIKFLHPGHTVKLKKIPLIVIFSLVSTFLITTIKFFCHLQ